MSSPLETLIVDASQGLAESLHAHLDGRVQLDPSNGWIYLLHDEQTPRERVLLTLLGHKALAVLRTDEEMGQSAAHSEGMSPKSIEEMTGIPGGTIRPLLASLLRERLVQKRDGTYFIPVPSVTRAARQLRDREG